MSPFLKDKRKRCRTGALLLLAGSVLAGTVPNTGELPKIPVGGLTVSAQELDIESIEAMQGGGATGAGQNAETVDGQGTSANSDTLAGYGKPSDNGQSADGTLAGD